MPWAHLGRLATHPQLWASAADQLGAGVALVARDDLRYLVVNEVLAQMNGVPVDAHIGRSVPDVMSEQSWEWLAPLYQRVFAGEEVTTRYTDHVDGVHQVADVRLSPVLEDGQVAAVLVVVTDVSVAEAIRRNSDRLLVLALELNVATTLAEVANAVVAHSLSTFGAVDAGVYWRREGHLLRLSRQGAMDATVSGMERVPLAAAVPVAVAVSEGRSLWLRQYVQWQPFPMFLEAVRKLGWPVVAVVPLDVAGEVQGALYLTFPGGRDVDEHEEQAVHTLAALCAAAVERVVRAENAARVADRLLETTGRLEALDTLDLFGVVRGDGSRALTANGRFLSMLGMRQMPQDGVAWSSLTPSRWHDEDAVAFLRAGRPDGVGHAYEKEFLRADGTTLPALVSLVRSRIDPVEFTAVVLDLSDVKANEAARRSMLEDRDRLSQAVQTALLPRVDSLFAGSVRVLTAYQPGDDRLALGGDFYDVVNCPDGQVGLLVGDVCGHGPLAAAAAAACRVAWRTAILAGSDLKSAAELVERVLRSERVDEDMFATIISATYDPGSRQAQIVAAGHPPPVLIDVENGHESVNVVNGPLLGVFDDAQQVVNRLTLTPGQALLFYTDGLIEGRASPTSPERLDQEGLHELLTTLTVGDLQHPHRIIAAANARHGADLPDDVALLLLFAPETPGAPDAPATA